MIVEGESLRDVTECGRLSCRWLEIWRPECRPLVELGISSGVLAEAEAPYMMERRGDEPEHYDLFYILDCELALETPGRDHVLRSGDFFAIPSYMPRRYTLRSGPCFRHAYFKVDADNPRHTLKLRDMALKPSQAGRHVAALLEVLTDNSLRFASMAPVLEKHGELLAAWLLREINESKPRVGYATLEAFDHLWRDVRLDPAGAWDVARLARRMKMSAPHFFALCRELHGVSPMRKVAEIRLGVAKELLSVGQTPLKDVAAAAGYGFESSLSAAFLRQEGMRPGDYRRRVQMRR